ncbi:hypothetical protein F4561_005406 [Lipingzhangella halophila]|uniref:Uncharacterized protein n=1 Tax=Lipingzhangella halophila TaxID=1783352 RepID=A0A7W7RN89_9ACTN|nr:hypothetical protein [Lipingzhangella halophila]
MTVRIAAYHVDTDVYCLDCAARNEQPGEPIPESEIEPCVLCARGSTGTHQPEPEQCCLCLAVIG